MSDTLHNVKIHRGERTWLILNEAERRRIRALLKPDPGDDLDALVSRCKRALQILEGKVA